MLTSFYHLILEQGKAEGKWKKKAASPFCVFQLIAVGTIKSLASRKILV